MRTIQPSVTLPFPGDMVTRGRSLEDRENRDRFPSHDRESAGTIAAAHLCGTGVALKIDVGWGGRMSLVRLLGFKTLECGCLTGHYRELATSREIAYIEEKGATCVVHGHRRNHTVVPARQPRATAVSLAARAS
jgi:hypothetical protein